MLINGLQFQKLAFVSKIIPFLLIIIIFTNSVSFNAFGITNQEAISIFRTRAYVNNYSYSVTGQIQNNHQIPMKITKVTAIFLNSSSKLVDMASDNNLQDKILQPGETTTFDLTTRNTNPATITNYTVFASAVKPSEAIISIVKDRLKYTTTQNIQIFGTVHDVQNGQFTPVDAKVTIQAMQISPSHIDKAKEIRRRIPRTKEQLLSTY
jgi:hypothetical protein